MANYFVIPFILFNYEKHEKHKKNIPQGLGAYFYELNEYRK